MDGFSTPLVTAVREVAAFERISPVDLPPLVDSVSEETATRLTTEWADQTEPIEFTYLSHHITVSPTGEVIIRL